MLSAHKRYISLVSHRFVRSQNDLTAEQYGSLLKACAAAKDIPQGRQLHSQLSKCKLDRDTYIGNLLVNMYGNCGCITEARSAFENIEKLNVFSWNIMIAAYAQCGYLLEARQMFNDATTRNVVTWNTIIAAYAQGGHCEMALQLFEQLLQSRIRPSVATFLSVLDACSTAGWLDKGRCTHQKISRYGLESDPKVASALINMYGKCRSLSEALKVLNGMLDKVVVARNAMVTAYAQNGYIQDARDMFDGMEERTVVSWNTMVAAYAQNGYTNDALQLFKLMLLDGTKPDKVSFASVLESCTAVEEARRVHALVMECRCRSDVEVVTTLVNAYGKCGFLEEATELFKRAVAKDVILWTTMITACAQNGQMSEARSLFEAAPSKNVVSWTTMITGYAQAGNAKEMLKIFRQMDLEGIQPNRVTLVCLLDACADLVALADGKTIYTDIADYGDRTDTIVGNALLNLYGKCGCVQEARSIFTNLRGRTSTSWTAMITTYAQTGHRNEAIELLQEMVLDGIEPNEITYISVLSACSHDGQLEKAWEHFLIMVGDHSLEPVNFHYMCMIDALGRAGQLSRGEELLHNMPFEPGSVAFSSLLGACRVHKDTEMAARVARVAGPEGSAPYVLLSSMIHSEEIQA